MAWKHRRSARIHPRTACAMRTVVNIHFIYQAFLKAKEGESDGRPAIYHAPCLREDELQQK